MGNKFEVTYTLTYLHEVTVGVEAESRDEALHIAKKHRQNGGGPAEAEAPSLLFERVEAIDPEPQWEIRAVEAFCQQSFSAQVSQAKQRALVEKLASLSPWRLPEGNGDTQGPPPANEAEMAVDGQNSHSLLMDLIQDARRALQCHPPPRPEGRAGATDARAQRKWSLNAPRMELVSPDGTAIPLTHNELCVLKTVAASAGGPVSRKALIEALGHKAWYYDERRLETLISRLRRKLALYWPEGVAVRAIRGKGYLFDITIREL